MYVGIVPCASYNLPTELIRGSKGQLDVTNFRQQIQKKKKYFYY